MRTGRLSFAVSAVVALIGGAVTASAAAPAYTVRTATTFGHRTTPVWYHDTVATRVGSGAAVAWTSDAGTIVARRLELGSGAWTGTPVRVSQSVLDCHCVDSTGTNPNRHDVPTLVTDRAGRVYALYGGGTAAQTGDRRGPFLRIAGATGSITAWLPERRLGVPGAVYDMQAVSTSTGVVDIVGQQGRNDSGAGSLILLRLHSGSRGVPGHFDTFAAPFRTLVAGGARSTACSWRFHPGCNVFVEGNLAAGPVDARGRQRLFLTWNWAEANLSDSCGDPAGFCNHGLYAAYSDDQGRTWHNLAGTASVDIRSAPLRYDAAYFALVPASTDVGLFKAVAVSGVFPGTAWIAFQPGADVARGAIRIGRWSGRRWTSTTLDRSRPWNNHLVLRTTRTGRVLLWSDVAQTGNHAGELDQWRREPSTGGWRRTTLTVGPNWYLTGTAFPGAELLAWRAPAAAGRTRVNVTIVVAR